MGPHDFDTDGQNDHDGPGRGAIASMPSEVRRGLKWSFVNVAVSRVGSILLGIALARILVPHDYGVFAPALAIVNILFGVNDLGVLLAVVRWKGNLREAARTAHTLAVASSAALYAGCFVAAPWFASVVDSPESATVLRVLALTVFIDGFTTVSHGLLVRGFHQDRFAKAEFAALPANVVISVSLALAGAGVWSLVAGQILANCVSGVLVYRAAPFRPGFGWSPSIARSMLAYGLPLAGTSFVEYVLLNADYLIVSRSLDATAVGLYLLAFNVSNWPLTIITDAVRRVSIAGFATLEGDATSLRRNFGAAMAALLTAALPLLAAMSLLATPLIGFVYGDAWRPAGEVLSVLVILSGARMAIGFIFDLLVGVGRSRTTLWAQVAWLAVLVPALQLGVTTNGLRGVAVAHALVAMVIALPIFAFAAHRAGADVFDVCRRLARPALATVVAVAIGLTIRDRLGGEFTTLAGVGSLVVVLYLALVLRRDGAAAIVRWMRSRRLSVTGQV
jgi:O-antigen/teichoic acid export membrane protein